MQQALEMHCCSNTNHRKYMYVYIYLHTHTYTEKIPSMSCSLKRIFHKKEFPEPMDTCLYIHRHHHLQNKWLLTTEIQLKGFMQPAFTTVPSHKSMTLRTNKYIAFSYIQGVKMQLANAIQRLHALGSSNFRIKYRRYSYPEFTALFRLNCQASTVSSWTCSSQKTIMRYGISIWKIKDIISCYWCAFLLYKRKPPRDWCNLSCVSAEELE